MEAGNLVLGALFLKLSPECRVGFLVSRAGLKGGCSRPREQPCRGAEDNSGNTEKPGVPGAWAPWRGDVRGESMWRHIQNKSGQDLGQFPKAMGKLRRIFVT